MLKALLIVLITCSGLSFAQQDLPVFEFKGTEEGTIQSSDIPRNRTFFVLYFSPDCDHCNAQAAEIKANIERFDRAVFLWVNAFNELDEIKAFQEKYFAGKSNFMFAKDVDWAFDGVFGESQVPSIYVYDSQGTRIASYTSTDGEFETIPAITLASHIK